MLWKTHEPTNQYTIFARLMSQRKGQEPYTIFAVRVPVVRNAARLMSQRINLTCNQKNIRNYFDESSRKEHRNHAESSEIKRALHKVNQPALWNWTQQKRQSTNLLGKKGGDDMEPNAYHSVLSNGNCRGWALRFILESTGVLGLLKLIPAYKLRESIQDLCLSCKGGQLNLYIGS